MAEIVSYFEQYKELGIFALSALPITELRAAVPAGIAIGIHPILVFLLCVAGNMLPVPFVLLLARPIFSALKKTKLFGFAKRIEDRAMDKSTKVQEKSMMGLFLLVAIPLPGTGAWTGALVASLINMRYKNAIPAIFLGVVASGVIVMAASLMLKYGLFSSGLAGKILEFLK